MSQPCSPITSRFQIVPSPTISPAKCCICGAYSRPVVDTGLELTVEGYAYRVYICVLCARDMNRTVEEHLISTGQLESGAEAQVQKYLEDNNYKVINSDHYDSLIFWACGLDGAVGAMANNPLNDTEESEGESGLPTPDADGDADEPEGSVGGVFEFDTGVSETFGE